jgi:hypothetical protein
VAVPPVLVDAVLVDVVLVDAMLVDVVLVDAVLVDAVLVVLPGAGLDGAPVPVEGPAVVLRGGVVTVVVLPPGMVLVRAVSAMSLVRPVVAVVAVEHGGGARAGGVLGHGELLGDRTRTGAVRATRHTVAPLRVAPLWRSWTSAMTPCEAAEPGNRPVG